MIRSIQGKKKTYKKRVYTHDGWKLKEIDRTGKWNKNVRMKWKKIIQNNTK